MNTLYEVSVADHCYHGSGSFRKLAPTSSLLEVRRQVRQLGVTKLVPMYDDHLWWLEAKAPAGDFVSVAVVEVDDDDGFAYIIPDSELPYRETRYDDDWNHGRLGACDC